METIKNIFSVSPDSYIPLKHSSTINLIFWLALSLFILEKTVIMIIQFGLPVSQAIPLNLFTNITTIIQSTFIYVGFPYKFLEMIKPFSPTIYGVLYVILIASSVIFGVINGIIEHFTDKKIDILDVNF